LKRTKFYINYAIGCDDGTGNWGLKLMEVFLEECFKFTGQRGDRILQFTDKGLIPIYRWGKQWIKIKTK